MALGLSLASAMWARFSIRMEILLQVTNRIAPPWVSLKGIATLREPTRHDWGRSSGFPGQWRVLSPGGVTGGSFGRLGAREDRRTRNRRRCLAPRTGNAHWHPSPQADALFVAFLDRQGSTLRDVELHIGTCAALAPHLEPARDASRHQRATCIEDWIASTLGQDLFGVHHSIALAVLAQRDRH